QPSTTHPTAAPWLSPNVVTRNRWPNVLNDMASPVRGCVIPRVGAGQIARTRKAAGSTVAAHAAVGEPIDHALADIERGRLGGRGDAKDRDQRPRGAAVSDDDGIAVERVVPLAHAQRDLRVTFTARRHEVPFVVLARGQRLRGSRADVTER